MHAGNIFIDKYTLSIHSCWYSDSFGKVKKLSFNVLVCQVSVSEGYILVIFLTPTIIHLMTWVSRNGSIVFIWMPVSNTKKRMIDCNTKKIYYQNISITRWNTEMLKSNKKSFLSDIFMAMRYYIYVGFIASAIEYKLPLGGNNQVVNGEKIEVRWGLASHFAKRAFFYSTIPNPNTLWNMI